MTIVNIINGKKLLMFATLAFTVYCLIGLILLVFRSIGKRLSTILMELGAIALLSFFVVTGSPEGFSIVWSLLIPTAGLFVFGMKEGSIVCAIMYAILMFFLQIPAGQKFLMYDYSEAFRLRFPMAFIAFYLISLFLENIRKKTSKALKELQANQDELISKQTAEIRDQNMELLDYNSKLTLRNKLLNKTFGRFLPDEVITSLLNTSEGFELSGKKSLITVLQSDIRGFSGISSHMEAMAVVDMLNHYLAKMSDIIEQHNGLVISFIGDAILVVFGARDYLQRQADDAVACALAMQIAMKEVNEYNEEHGYAHLEMGIGVHTGDAVLGTIGSERHLKYDVIGNTINLGNRIESYSVGGQVLVSAETIKRLNAPVAVANTFVVMPKGCEAPMKLSDVTAIGGKYQVEIPLVQHELVPLDKKVHVQFVRVEDKHCEMELLEGDIIADSPSRMLLQTEATLYALDNIRIQCACGITGKVIKQQAENEYIVRYTYRMEKFKGFCNCNCKESEKYFSFNLEEK